MRVFVFTSNAYTRFIPPFAKYFNQYWSDMQGVTVVGYDQLPPLPLPRNFLFVSLGKQSHYNWSSGVAAWLRQISDPTLIVMLEDYFLDRPVDIARLQTLATYMNAHPDVAKIDLSDDRLKTPYEFYEDGLIRSADDAPFQASLQAAMWRRDTLLRFLKEPESPWQFEKAGTRRMVVARKAGEWGGLILGCQRPPLHYVNAVGGGQGDKDQGGGTPVWALKRIPPWMQEDLKTHGWLNGA